VAGNRIELWGRVLGEPELRTTPAGTSVLRFAIDGPGESGLSVVMTGETAQRLLPSLKTRAEIRVTGSLKMVRRRLKSGLIEAGYEVVADSIKVEESVNRRN
jgi:hypothetical protein